MPCGVLIRFVEEILDQQKLLSGVGLHATADPLEPGVKYRLLIEAGSVTAQHDFVPVPRTR